jgi:hypothetical protein
MSEMTTMEAVKFVRDTVTFVYVTFDTFYRKQYRYAWFGDRTKLPVIGSEISVPVKREDQPIVYKSATVAAYATRLPTFYFRRCHCIGDFTEADELKLKHAIDRLIANNKYHRLITLLYKIGNKPCD